MPIKLTVTMSNFAQALRHIEKVVDYINGPAGEDVTLAAFNAGGTVFEKNFDAEGKGFGLGGWDDLEESTVRDRLRKGFGGEHPILIRYNDLRTVTATSLRVAGGSGTFGATDPDGRTIRVELHVGSNGGYATATGDKAWNQIPTTNAPARPFWFTTKTVQFAMRKRAIEKLADSLSRL